MTVHAKIIYGWDFSPLENRPLLLQNDDESDEFRDTIEAIKDKISSSEYYHELDHFHNNEQCAFGIVLDEFHAFANVDLSFVTLQPSEQQVEELQEALKAFNEETQNFFEEAGPPQRFILWYQD